MPDVPGIRKVEHTVGDIVMDCDARQCTQPCVVCCVQVLCAARGGSSHCNSGGQDVARTIHKHCIASVCLRCLIIRHNDYEVCADADKHHHRHSQTIADPSSEAIAFQYVHIVLIVCDCLMIVLAVWVIFACRSGISCDKHIIIDNLHHKWPMTVCVISPFVL